MNEWRLELPELNHAEMIAAEAKNIATGVRRMLTAEKSSPVENKRQILELAEAMEKLCGVVVDIVKFIRPK